MRLTETQRELTKILHAEPGLTIDTLIEKAYPSYHPRNVKQSFESMLRQEMVVVESDGTITLSSYLSDIAESAAERERKKGAIVKPAEPPVFQPLSAKFIPSAKGTRNDEPVREFHPHSLVSNVPATGAVY